jgi:hypothetical protein
MPNNNGDNDESQCGSDIQAHFDIVELTIPPTRHNNAVASRAECSLPTSFYEWAPVTSNRPPRPYFDSRNHHCWRRDFYLHCAQVIMLGPDRQTVDRIVIRNTDRGMPGYHHRIILMIGDSLTDLGYEYLVSRAEIALDAHSEESGRLLATSILPKWGRLEERFNFESGEREPGGSCDGFDEYMFSGRPRWVETASGNPSLRSPGRQFHCYHKHSGIWRYELRFFQKYLRAKHINTVPELFRAAPNLITNNIAFRRLNMRKLRQEHASSRNWGLTGKSIPEQIQIIMHRLRCSRQRAERYFERIGGPPIDLSLFEIYREFPWDGHTPSTLLESEVSSITQHDNPRIFQDLPTVNSCYKLFYNQLNLND